MNASSSTSAAMATKTALATSVAGCRKRSLLKAITIAQSKIGIGSALAALLIRGVGTNVLSRGDEKSQSPAVRLRGEASDLIQTRKIFGPGCKENVARKAPLLSSHDGKAQTCDS